VSPFRAQGVAGRARGGPSLRQSWHPGPFEPLREAYADGGGGRNHREERDSKDRGEEGGADSLTRNADPDQGTRTTAIATGMSRCGNRR
jgi:hypothetical protein